MEDQITVTIDRELEDLVPTYLKNLRANTSKIHSAIAAGDFEQARVLGHNMKGSGGGYGLDFVSERGREIEEAAKTQAAGPIEEALNQLAMYLDRLTIRYTDQS